MKISLKAIVSAALLMVAAGGVLAESTYGYDPTGAGSRSAKAELIVEVKIPKLILLRVGADGSAVDTASIVGAFSPGIPGGVANASLVDGNDGSSDWTGAKPAFGDSQSAGINAVAWTNGSGATLDGSFVTNFTDAALGAAITVEGSNDLTDGSLNHPGGNLGTLGSTPITRNKLLGSTWTFKMTGANLGTFASGTYTARIKYTASSL